MLNNLPFFACGEIVSGFGRGSKDLGIPTGECVCVQNINFSDNTTYVNMVLLYFSKLITPWKS